MGAPPPAAGEEIALGAQVRQHGGEERRDAQGKEESRGQQAQRATPPGKATVASCALQQQPPAPPEIEQGDEDEQERRIGEFGPRLEGQKDTGQRATAYRRAIIGRVERAPEGEHGKGDPLAAGDVELAETGVEQLSRGKGGKAPGDDRNGPGHARMAGGQLLRPDGARKQKDAIAAQDK